MIIDIGIIMGLAVTAYLNWKTLNDLSNLEEIVAGLLMELNQKEVITLGKYDAP